MFDVADLIKDAYVMPWAFDFAVQSRDEKHAFRNALLTSLIDNGGLDYLFGVVQDLSGKSDL